MLRLTGFSCLEFRKALLLKDCCFLSISYYSSITILVDIVPVTEEFLFILAFSIYHEYSLWSPYFISV